MKSSGIKTIAVFSQFRAGHISAYHRLYVERFAAQGCRVLDLSPPSDTPWSQRLLRQLDRFPRWRARRAWRKAAQAVQTAERAIGCPVDAVFLIFLDIGFLERGVTPTEADRWFPWRWAGVTNEPAAVRGPVPVFFGREQVLAAANCRAVVVTDDAFADSCRAVWPGKSVIVMPEVADLSSPGTSVRLKELRSFARGRRLVGLLGVISSKKNIEAFLALARVARTALPGVAFFLAGDFSVQACPGPERRALASVLAQAPDNCRLFPDPLEDGPEFNAWIDACDVVWAAYREVFYKSNVLTKAAYFRKPVIVSPGRVMAAHTAAFRLGEIVGVDDTLATLAALERLLADPHQDRDFAGFVALNSVSRLDETVSAIINALES